MLPLVVVFDSCVLHRVHLRNVLMYLAEGRLFQARWTDAIHEEWIRSVLRTKPQITREQLEKTRRLMNAHSEECLVTGYESLIPHLKLPDENDRHVLAAAIHCRARSIVTFDLKDFPHEALRELGLQAQHPDDFLLDQLRISADVVCAAAKRHREAFKKPALSAIEYLTLFDRQGIPQTIARLMTQIDKL